jgi:hypothetical protein
MGSIIRPLQVPHKSRGTKKSSGRARPRERGGFINDRLSISFRAPQISHDFSRSLQLFYAIHRCHWRGGMEDQGKKEKRASIGRDQKIYEKNEGGTDRDGRTDGRTAGIYISIRYSNSQQGYIAALEIFHPPPLRNHSAFHWLAGIIR